MPFTDQRVIELVHATKNITIIRKAFIAVKLIDVSVNCCWSRILNIKQVSDNQRKGQNGLNGLIKKILMEKLK